MAAEAAPPPVAQGAASPVRHGSESRATMKITDIRTFVVGNPPPYFGGRYFIFLKLIADNGIEGGGEVYAPTFPPQTIVAMIRDVFAPHVLGADPFRIEAPWRNVYGRGYSQPPPIPLI